MMTPKGIRGWRMLVVVAMAFVAVGIAGMAGAQAPPKVLKLGHVFPITDYLAKSAQLFADTLEKKSGGALKVEVYPAGQLGGDRAILEGVTIGSVDIHVVGAGALNLYDPLGQIFLVPYMIRDRQHADKVWDGPIGAEIADKIAAKTGLRIVAFWDRGARNLTTVKKPVYKMADLKGLKIRVPENPISIAAWKAFGAIPTPMAFPEVFTALQTGIIDAQENPLTLIYSAGFHKVAKYLVMTEHLVAEDAIVVFKDSFYQGLPPAQKRAIQEAAAEAKAFARRALAEDERAAFAELRKAMTVIQPEKEEFRKAVAGIIPQFPHLVDLYQRIVAVK
ncbi:MAG: TRAP transporter substrate-binding protein [candidate division NC10 bacterium]|nr:TRAP transporter substrate-binding protein [candidate division NC10 bacterium]